MNKFVTYVKTHPILSTIFFVVFLIALYLILRKGGGGTVVASSGVSPQERIAEDQINAALQAKQLDTSAALSAQQSHDQAQITLSANQLAAQLQAAQLQATTEQQKIAADQATTTATLTAQQNIAQINADATTHAIAAQADIINAQTEAQRDTQLATIGYFTSRDTAEYNVQVAEIQAQRDVALQKLSNDASVIAVAPGIVHSDRGSGGVASILSALFGQGQYQGTSSSVDVNTGSAFSVGIPGVGGFSFKG